MTFDKAVFKIAFYGYFDGALSCYCDSILGLFFWQMNNNNKKYCSLVAIALTFLILSEDEIKMCLSDCSQVGAPGVIGLIFEHLSCADLLVCDRKQQHSSGGIFTLTPVTPEWYHQVLIQIVIHLIV